ncbi:ABC transporter permease [Acetobacter thailandicus]|uniref:ABC transporter permease n=1 Tax=Acetobacter thailandicus TaxID=1502842 RepID=A0ABT3QCI0_9PROT|nr:ABC transporter permease [Acetobacter thailandicus]MCX2562934.1 ABC transporter permease [Acetobacter thailandicus]NHN95662.1 ABC transporter permease subunit [Acetobacter thailandicus]
MSALSLARRPWGLSRAGLLWGVVSLACVLLPGAALWVYHQVHPFGIDLHHRLLAPSWQHWLGTDPLGRDTLAYTLVAAVNSLGISVVAMVLALCAGGSAGLLAAEKGRRTKILTGGVVELGIAFPPVITAALLVTLYGAGMGEEVFALAIFFIPGFIRLSQQAASAILAQDYIAAARLSALTPWQTHMRHVLPNMAPGLLVQFSVNVALALLAETGLSYLGLGAPPPLPELGRILASYQVHLFDHPVLVVVPGVIVVLLVLGINMLGDGLRDLFARQEKTS